MEQMPLRWTYTVRSAVARDVSLTSGLNNYEWCGNETLTSSNWNVITAGFSALPVVTYMSEFGQVVR